VERRAHVFAKLAVTVELARHVLATPAASRRNLRLETHCSPASLRDSGGVLEIEEAGCGA
jgi:hypothetical protein